MNPSARNRDYDTTRLNLEFEGGVVIKAYLG
jgi:hypothetical protein